MTKLNQESGRSMVEMLGVLAIIGVLSIGGIAGYTMAMNRYRANEVLNAASQLAVIAETMNQGNGGTANLDDIGGTVVGASAIEATRSGTTTTVKITANSTEINSAINSIVGGTNCPTSGNSLE
ncbi:MAG: type II secretion system protein, partial [Alphaproteobacteria bacterium]|nr:type II secretion system protein [Alphaproteobacteria bacterium]